MVCEDAVPRRNCGCLSQGGSKCSPNIWKVYDKQKLIELHRRCTLEGLAPKIRCPLLVIHGTKDFVPVEQARRVYDEASGPKEWVLLEGGNHVCNNLPYRYRPLVGDFLAKHLGATA